MIEKLSNILASQIANQLKIDRDHEEILAYGAFSLFQTLFSILLIVIFGMAFNILLEVLTISISGAILRKYSGGAHATDSNRCAFIGMIISGILGILVHKNSIYMDIKIIYFFIIFSFLFTYYIIYQYAPVDTPNKPIKKEERRKKLKRLSIIVIHSFLGITGILLFIYFNSKSQILLRGIFSISMGLFWQALTLTYLGHIIIYTLDSFLKRLYIRGGKK